jgi:hypothetical protein
MKNYPGICVIFLCIAFIFGAGCESQTGGSVPTTAPATAIPTPSGTTMTTEIPTISPNATLTVPPPLPTVTPEPDPTNVAEINFSHYSDSDFSLDYPTAWSVAKSTFTLYNCNSVETDRCYLTEIQTIGPFDFHENAHLKKEVRVVTFASADGSQRMVAFISDFLDGLTGNFMLNPDLTWAQAQVARDYPDIGSTGVGNYQYSRSGNTMSSRFTVVAPPGSVEYPLEYTKKNFVTIHHIYEFAIISDREHMEKYYNLDTFLLTSVTPADKA